MLYYSNNKHAEEGFNSLIINHSYITFIDNYYKHKQIFIHGNLCFDDDLKIFILKVYILFIFLYVN